MNPPQSIAELLARASALAGQTLPEIARGLGGHYERGLHSKGKVGTLMEHVLGAAGLPGAELDFPTLGVELKTLPLGQNGKPSESTYVCTVPLADADQAEWETSWVRAKLRQVLWVPYSVHDARILRAWLWTPSPEQDALLREDFDEIMGLLGSGRAEELTAHLGQILQARPKAAHGRVRAQTWTSDADAIGIVPRGFYLRPSFTASLLLEATRGDPVGLASSR